MGFALSDMQLGSSAFSQGGAIPKRHTGEAEDVSPELTFSKVPEGTKAFAVICHDPDAPLLKEDKYGFVHWVLYNIPASTTKLEEDVSAHTAGANDFGNTGYGGPMPPPGHGRHHYFFWVFALDRDLGLEPGLTQGQLLAGIEPHVLGMNRLVGTYERS